LECIKDNFIIQVIDSLTGGEALLDLLLTNTDELISEVRTDGSLGCSDCALVELMILWHMGQMKCKARTLNFRRANFQLFKELVDGTRWETALGVKEQNRAGSFLRTFCLDDKSSRFLCIREQARRTGDQHG